MAKKLTKKQANVIEDILLSFNFEIVFFAMNYMGWSWVGSNEPDRIPNRTELEDVARRLLTELVLSGDTSHGTCGLEAELQKDDGELTLRFVLTEHSEYI